MFFQYCIHYFLPKNPRKEVPWGIAEAVLALVFFYVLPPLLVGLIFQLFCPELLPTNHKRSSSTSIVYEHKTDLAVKAPTEETDRQRKLQVAHPLESLLLQSYGSSSYYWVVLLTLMMAVIVAPLTEEFLFRVVFQGAFEKGVSIGSWVSTYRRRMAILLPALLFAAIHYRTPQPAANPAFLMMSMLIIPFAYIITLGLIILALQLVFQADWENFGLSFPTIGQDIFRGMFAFLLIFPLLILTMVLLHYYFPDQITDPIPLFIFAIGLGILYWRTHRFSSIVAMHASLNLYSILNILAR